MAWSLKQLSEKRTRKPAGGNRESSELLLDGGANSIRGGGGVPAVADVNTDGGTAAVPLLGGDHGRRVGRTSDHTFRPPGVVASGEGALAAAAKWLGRWLSWVEHGNGARGGRNGGRGGNAVDPGKRRRGGLKQGT
nr:unnamed protein product [Digitaria exilis]